MTLGRAALASPDYPGGPPDGAGKIAIDGREWAFQHVNVGNPQCVVDAGDEVDRLDLQRLGRRIEIDELSPNRTNVSFVRFSGSDVRARMFAPGIGVTEDPATGSACVALGGYLAERDPRFEGTLAWMVEQRELMAATLAAWANGDRPEVIHAGAKPEALSREQDRIAVALDIKYAAYRTASSAMSQATREHYRGRTYLRLVPDERILSWDNRKLGLS